MMRRTPVVLFAVALLGSARPALAADVLSNSYWDAAYLNNRIEVESGGASNSVDREGFRLGASLGLAKFLNFTGDFEQTRLKDGRLGFGSAGLAFHTQDPVYQFFGAVTYERVEGDDNADPSNDYVEDGYGVEVGARYAFSDVEVHAAYRYLNFDTLDQTKIDFTGGRYGIGADIQLSPWWSLAADYRVREHKFDGSGVSVTTDYNEWTVGFRHYFATDTDRKNRHGGLLSGMSGGGE